MTVYMTAHLFFIGNNTKGQCILPDAYIAVPTAASIDASIAVPTADSIDGRHVLQVAVGDSLSLLLTDDNLLFAVGNNDTGQLGRGHNDDDDPDNHVPRPVAGVGLERITLVAAGFGHCAAVTEGGKLFLWGRNDHGQCGTGTFGGNVLAATQCDSGVLADADVRVVFVACGWAHTVALTSDGGVIAFGYNAYGELGTGNYSDQPAPERLACAALDGVHIMCCAAGASFTQLVRNDGRVFAMGKNTDGQLGTGDMTSVNTPTEIDAAHFDGAPVAALSCGVGHTMAITRGEGKLYCWGKGAHGRTGFGHTDNTLIPQRVMGALADARVVRIAAGYLHSCALVEGGRVFAFGRAIGIPDEGWSGIPQRIAEELGVCALGTGCYGTHAAFVTGAPPTEPGDGWLFEKIRQLKSQIAEAHQEWKRHRAMFPTPGPVFTLYLDTQLFTEVAQLKDKILAMQTEYSMTPDVDTVERQAANRADSPLPTTIRLRF